MESRQQPQISIICVGESHNDPASKACILSALKRFHENKIPIVYCAERPHDSDLGERLDTLKKEISAFENGIKCYHLDKYFYDSSGNAFQYFNINNKEDFQSTLKQQLEDKDLPIFQELCDEYIKLFAKWAEMKLLNYLIGNNIDYVTIDKKKSQWYHFTDLLHHAKSKTERFDIYCDHENDRIDTMVNMIFHKAIPPLQSTGGIIICHVGAMHAHRLVANLQAKHKVPLIALYCYSDLEAENANKHHQHDLTISKLRVDSPEIKQLYEHIPYLMLHFNVNDKNELYNKKFDDIVTSYLDMKKSRQIKLTQGLVYGGAMALVGLFCFKMLTQTNICSYVNPMKK